jgi:hypothetical protein
MPVKGLVVWDLINRESPFDSADVCFGPSLLPCSYAAIPPTITIYFRQWGR